MPSHYDNEDKGTQDPQKSQDERVPGEAMSWEQIQTQANNEIDAAIKYGEQNLSMKRIEYWDRYYGRPLGNEVAGRSQFISRDLIDVIEWMMPYLIRQFTSTDPKIDIKIEGQEPWVGLALLNKIREDLAGDKDSSLFRLFYQWFKEGLVTGMSVLKVFWVLEHELKSVTWPELDMKEMMKLHDDKDVQFLDLGEQGPPGSDRFTNVKTEIKSIRKSGLSASNVPSWEFIFDSDTSHMNDEHGKGHMTKVSMDYIKRINRARGGDFFKHLDSIEEAAPTTEDPSGVFINADSEKQSYLDNKLPAEFDKHTDTKGPASQHRFVEWNTRMDVNGDGYLEDIICYVADRKLIRWQDNGQGMINMSAINPIIDCFKMAGISLGELINDIQNLKTMLIRRGLDNFEFVNLGIWLSGDDNIDRRKLMEVQPGDVVRGDPNNTKRIAPEDIGTTVFSLLGYADQMRESRTGIAGRQGAMGTTPDHGTLGGMKILQSSTIARLELISRIFAETGISDFYTKCCELYQQYMTRPFTAKVKGREVQITREMIQGAIKSTVNMGIEAEVGQFEAAKVQQITEYMVKFNEIMPGMLGLEQAHNLASRFVSSHGFRQTDDFVPGLKQLATAAQGSAEKEAAMMQMQQAMADAEMQIKGSEVNLKAAEVQGKLDTDDQKIAVAMEEIKRKARKDMVDAKLKIIGIKLDDRPQVNV